MKCGVNYLVANCNCGLAHGHKAHTDILDNVSGRQGQVAHFLGVYLLGLGYDGDVSIVNCGVKQGEKSECKTRAHFCVLVLCIDKVNLIMRGDEAVCQILTEAEFSLLRAVAYNFSVL